VIRIINEPTAAVLAYKTVEETIVLVFDCGGGTTDLSVTCVDSLDYQVLETVGDLNLGGNDITEILVEYFYSMCPCKKEIEQSEYRIEKVMTKLRVAAEKCKKELSYNKSVSIYIDGFYQDTDFSFEISQTKYRFLIQPFLQKIKDLIDQIKTKYSLVIFIGGSSRIPFLRELFGSVPIKCDLDPDTTVAQGAGYQGYLLTETELPQDAPLLIDTVSLSVGIQLDGGIMGSIISRGTAIPTEKSLEFRTSMDYESEYKIHFYQGECRFVKDNAYLGTLLLTDISSALKGQVLLTIEMSIDTDGVYTILAYETKRKKETLRKLELRDQTLEPSFVENNLVHATENLYIDLILSEKKLLKIQLCDRFMELLEIFDDRKELLLGSNQDSESFLMYKFNKIFTETKSVITNYTDYTVTQLKDHTQKFGDVFYSTLCSISQYDLEDGTFCTSVQE
jgi:molecular chaperone DnaK (HSP70)